MSPFKSVSNIMEIKNSNSIIGDYANVNMHLISWTYHL